MRRIFVDVIFHEFFRIGFFDSLINILLLIVMRNLMFSCYIVSHSASCYRLGWCWLLVICNNNTTFVIWHAVLTTSWDSMHRHVLLWPEVSEVLSLIRGKSLIITCKRWPYTTSSFYTSDPLVLFHIEFAFVIFFTFDKGIVPYAISIRLNMREIRICNNSFIIKIALMPFIVWLWSTILWPP